MALKNYYKTQATDIKPGDIFVAVVSVHIMPFGEPPFYKIFIANDWPPEIESGIPQGRTVDDPDQAVEIAAVLFPDLIKAGFRPE